ncbi:MAG: 4'-phosphopantetheinyl transferase superfamily protein [Clostridia bacterium]|nr:4'-phosphopantetheinyl transferase superfamily protein [Clostridia bacterium]
MVAMQKTFTKVLYTRLDSQNEINFENVLPTHVINHCQQKYHTQDAQKRSLYGYYLAYTLLKNERIEDDIQWNKDGKPYLKKGIYICISHTDNLIAVCLSNVNIGIDVETKSKVDIILSKKLLDSCSQKKYDTLNTDSEKIDFLTKIWCLKESLIKLDVGYSMSDLKEIIVAKIEDDYVLQNKYYGKVYDYNQEYLAVLSNKIIDSIIIDTKQE